MTDKEKPGRLRRLLIWMGRLLDRPYVDKAIFILVGHLSASSLLLPYVVAAIKFPDLRPAYLDPSGLLLIVWLHLGFTVLYLGLLMAALGIRRLDPDSQWPGYAAIIVITAQDAILLSAIGHATNPITLLFLFILAFISLLFFNVYLALSAIGTWVLVHGIHIVLEKLRLIPYAWALNGQPFTNGNVDNAWLGLTVGFGGLLMFLALAIFGFILKRWRERELQVIELSEMLKKMFGRYLSTEVMNSLMENPSALELGGESREVTIMMSDLRGFTVLSERLSPGQVVQMLNTYFEVMVDVVLRYNGTINEIIGDALLIVFGAPQDMSDRAQRAIACAIDMQNAMSRVNEKNSIEGLPELEMGIGLNEAEVVVGNIGSSKRSHYTVIGSGVNVASRIESYTVGGQILVSESVYREAGEVLRIDGQRVVHPKGIDTPIKIFEVGGIAGLYNLALDERDPGPVLLAQRIPMRYTILDGKHVGEKGHAGHIVGLSKKSAWIVLNQTLDPLTNLKLNLGALGDEAPAQDFYGKIVKRLDPKAHLHLVGFTSVPPEVAAYFQALRQYAVKLENK